jgi:hypothetical protein
MAIVYFTASKPNDLSDRGSDNVKPWIGTKVEEFPDEKAPRLYRC